MERSSWDGTSREGGDCCVQVQRLEKRASDAIVSASFCTRLLRVLVSDDSMDVADSLAMLVRLWGHEVCVAYDGVEALRMASAYQADVVVLDVAMSGLDGFQLARELRQHPRVKDALLIAVTGYADEAHRLLGEAAGFDHYLVKPVGAIDLHALLGGQACNET